MTAATPTTSGSVIELSVDYDPVTDTLEVHGAGGPAVWDVIEDVEDGLTVAFGEVNLVELSALRASFGRAETWSSRLEQLLGKSLSGRLREAVRACDRLDETITLGGEELASLRASWAAERELMLERRRSWQDRHAELRGAVFAQAPSGEPALDRLRRAAAALLDVASEALAPRRLPLPALALHRDGGEGPDEERREQIELDPETALAAGVERRGEIAVTSSTLTVSFEAAEKRSGTRLGAVGLLGADADPVPVSWRRYGASASIELAEKPGEELELVLFLTEAG